MLRKGVVDNHAQEMFCTGSGHIRPLPQCNKQSNAGRPQPYVKAQFYMLVK